MAIGIDTYLQAQGFSAHPFATTNAEQEAGVLPSFFIRVAWFDWLVGNPSTPESAIIFAPQGFGKTSHRLEVARLVSERREAPALVVTLNDFGALVNNGVEHVSLDGYVALLRKATIEALDDQLEAAPQRRLLLQQNPRNAGQFHALLQLFAPLHAIGKPTPDFTDVFVQAFQRETLGPKAWLKELARLVACAGFVSVYCLLDGIDELVETRNDTASIFRVISPLLDAPGLMQECGFAFKFFLPEYIAAEMKQQGVGRLDRITHRSLAWDDAQLLAMLSQRLVSFNRFSGTSPLTRIQTFQDLCDPDVTFDSDLYLVQSARGSPRALVDLCRTVFDEHCQRSTNPDALITATTLQAAIKGGVADLPMLDRPAESLPVPQPIRLLDDAPPAIHLDERGDIWLGDQRLGNHLPGLMRRCLEYLWKQRHRRVTYDELLDELYGSSLDQRGDPRSSLEKLVRRLRETLEPGRPASRNYIETQTGSGYVLRNFADVRLSYTQ